MARACARRDAGYDGVFFLAVRTTGVFCRPSCPARKPLPKNTEYFPTAREAMFAGYRPCKRCRPLETDGTPPEWVRQLLRRTGDGHSARLRAADLRAQGIDPARARRYFLRHYGMTFQAYQRARRLGMALHQIRQGGNLIEVGYDTGYESPSGFRDAFVRTFGRSPGRSRSGDCVVTRMIESPVGPLLAGATSRALCLLEFTDRRCLETQLAVVRKRFGCSVVPGGNEHLSRIESELVEFFAGRRRTFDVALEYPGTEFQERVWGALLRIPYGETWSYERLAEEVGRPGAQRAVGTANGANRIAIVIPCHRVVNKDGRLGGYGGGLWRKQFLLDLERGQARLPEARRAVAAADLRAGRPSRRTTAHAFA
jgi:AraC family transcriptional regulator of adaptative response/methylated-DNA-[protein]-cysteine methyltransferase